jgi:hypothetical protein
VAHPVKLESEGTFVIQSFKTGTQLQWFLGDPHPEYSPSEHKAEQFTNQQQTLY